MRVERLVDLGLEPLRLAALRVVEDDVVGLLARRPVEPLPVLDLRQPQPGVEVHRVGAQDVAVEVRGAVERTLPGQDPRPPDVRLDRLEAALFHAAVDGVGLGVPPPPGEGLAEPQEDAGVVRVGRAQSLVEPDRLAELVLPGQDLGQLEGEVEVARRLRQRLTIAGDRRGEVAVPRLQERQPAQRVDPFGATLHRLLVQRPRLPVLAAVEGGVGGAHQVGHRRDRPGPRGDLARDGFARGGRRRQQQGDAERHEAADRAGGAWRADDASRGGSSRCSGTEGAPRGSDHGASAPVGSVANARFRIDQPSFFSIRKAGRSQPGQA